MTDRTPEGYIITDDDRIHNDNEMRFDVRIRFPAPLDGPFFGSPMPRPEHDHGPISEREIEEHEGDLVYDNELIRGDAGDLQPFMLAYPAFPLANPRPAGFDGRMRFLFDEQRAPTELGRFEQRVIDLHRFERAERDTAVRFQGPELYSPPPTPFLRPAAEHAERTFLEKVRDWLAARKLITIAPAPEED